MDKQRFNELDTAIREYASGGNFYGYHDNGPTYKSNLDFNETIGFLNREAREAEEHKTAKHFWNGVTNVMRGSLYGLSMLRDKNIKLRREQDENYQPAEYSKKLEEWTESDLLQRQEVGAGDNFASNTWYNFVEGMGQLGGQALMTIATGGNVVASTAAMGLHIAGNQYKELIDQGVDSDRAFNASFANAIIQAPMERIALGKIFNKLPAGSTLQARGKDILESIATESATEFMQTFPEQFTNIYALNEGIDAQGIAREWDKNASENVKEAVYSAFIGALIGGTGSTAKAAASIVYERYTNKVREEKLNDLKASIDVVKHTGIDTEYASAIIDNNHQGLETANLEADKLLQYMQTVNPEQVAKALDTTVEKVEKAANEGLDITVSRGRLVGTAAKFEGFMPSMGNHISFNEGEYTVNDSKLKEDLRREYNAGENAREALDIEVNKIVEGLRKAGISKQVSSEISTAFISVAARYNPENPAQYFKDHPIEQDASGKVKNASWLNQLVYHGTNANFDKFDLGTIGSSNGTAYGWGLYFAQDRQVTKAYGERIIEADIPNDDVLLHEHLPFAQQPKKVQTALKKLAQGLTDEQLENIDDVRRLGRAKVIAHVMDMLQEADGKNIYGTIWDIIGDSEHGKETSLLLNKYGIKGKKFADDNAGTQFVVFDDKAVEIIERYNQEYESESKGAIGWNEEGKAIISFFQKADASTVIHETGHYFIENFMQDSAKPTATEQMKRDRKALLDYAGITEEEWNNADFEGRRQAHEKWAEAFESYFIEGKAPKRELRSMFQRFSKWLKAVYENIARNPNAIPLTDEVRQVFDRMLASEEEIAAMERLEGYYNTLPTVITDNLSPKTKEMLLKQFEKVHDTAVNLLTKASLSNFTAERKREIALYQQNIKNKITESIALKPLYAGCEMLKTYMEAGKQAPKTIADKYLKEYGKEYATYQQELEDVTREINNRLNPIIEGLKAGIGKGEREYYIDLETNEEVDVSDLKGKEELANEDHFKLVKESLNATWYQEWTKDNGNVKPTERQFRELAYNIYTGNDQYGYFEGAMQQQSAEDFAYFEEVKAELDYYLQRQEELKALAMNRKADYKGNNIASYKDALALHKKQVSPAKIKQLTGWEISKEGKWSYAINERLNYKAISKPGTYFKLADLLTDKILINRYPWLKEIEALATLEDEVQNVSYNADKKALSISAKDFATTEERKAFDKAVIDTVVAIIQEREGVDITDELPVLKLAGVPIANTNPNVEAWTPKGLSLSDRETFEMIAQEKGYDSGEAFAKDILESPTFTQAVNKEIDNATQQKFPDIFKERERAEQAAREALYNDESGILIGLEQILIEEAANTALAKQRSNEAKAKLAAARLAQAEATAKAEIKAMTMGEAMNTAKMVTAERRAAANIKKAIKAGNYTEAHEYSRQQMLLHALVKESLKMRQTYKATQKYLKKQINAKQETWANEKHFNQAAALLARMGIPHKKYDPNISKQSLGEYVKEMTDLYGDIVDIAPWLLEETTPLSAPLDMTYDRYKDVIDALKNIKAIAKQDKTTNVLEAKQELGIFKAAIKEHLNKLESTQKVIAGVKSVAGTFESLAASVRTTDNLLNLMDGWTDGYFTKVFGKAMNIAGNNAAQMTMDYQRARVTAKEEWLPTWKARRAADKLTAYEELGNGEPGNTVSANKHFLVYMLANLGNEGNARVLCSTPPVALKDCALWVKAENGITEAQAIAMTRSNILNFLAKYLTKADVKYAQSLITNASRNWQALEQVNINTKGFAPARVEATNVTLKLATGETVKLKGGYFPLVMDGSMGRKPAKQEIIADDDKLQGRNITTMHTNTGSSKARVNAKYPIALYDGAELNSVFDTIHDIAYREVMLDFRNIFNDEEIYALFQEKLGRATTAQMRTTFELMAQPFKNYSTEIAEGLFNQSANWLRRKLVNVYIMCNIKTAFQNIGNVFLYGNAVDGFNYADVWAAMGNYGLSAFNPVQESKLNQLCAKSVFMQERVQMPDITIRDIKTNSKLNPVESSFMKWGTLFMAYTDNLSAKPVWAQAYLKKRNSGATEQEAIDFADTIIKRTLGSSRVQDVASIQRGTPLFKLFTTFQGFYITQLNQWIREGHKDISLFKEHQYKEALIRLSAFAAAKLMFPALVTCAVALEDPFEDDNNDEWLNISEELLHYPVSLFGPAGAVANLYINKLLGIKSYGYRMVAAETFLEQTSKTATVFNKIMNDKADFTDIIEPAATTAGIVIGVPAQLNKIFFNIWDMVENGMMWEVQDLIKRRPKNER